MTVSAPRIRDLLPAEVIDLSTVIAAVANVTKAGSASRLAASPNFLRSVASKAGDSVQRLLDVPLADVLVGAWASRGELLKFTDSERSLPDTVILVELADHRITSVAHPYIELDVDGIAVGKIRFELTLKIDVQGAALAIQSGRIEHLAAGRAAVRARLLCEGIMIAESDIVVDLTTALPPGSGVPIRPTA